MGCNGFNGCGNNGNFIWTIIIIAIIIFWLGGFGSCGCGNNGNCGCNGGCNNCCD